MNIFTDILFLFIYICTLFYFRIPDIMNHNYIYHELCIFVAIFVYFYAVDLIKTIKNGCKIKPYKMVKETLMMSLYVVLGYVFYVQLMYMDWSKFYIADVADVTDPTKRIISVALVMVLFVTLIKLTGMIFKNDNIVKCDNSDDNNDDN